MPPVVVVAVALAGLALGFVLGVDRETARAREGGWDPFLTTGSVDWDFLGCA